MDNIVKHDIKNKLQIIQSCIELLKLKLKIDENDKYCNMANESIEDIVKILNNIPSKK